MRSVRITFRLIHVYVFVLLLLVGLAYKFIVGLDSINKILWLAIPSVIFSAVYVWKRKTFFELYEISDSSFKIYYCFFGMRLRIVFLQFEAVRKLDRYHYQLISQDQKYSLKLNLEIEETELILKNSNNRRIFYSFNLDSMHENHRVIFESIFDKLVEGKPLS